MCGITGIIDFAGRTALVSRETIVRKMNDKIHHRGPDGEGWFSDDLATLAMRRLSIIDLEGGWQPLFNEDKTIAVFLNGEIYNYRQLRESLVQRGHQFRTESDTEVIAHLYEDVGDETAQHLKGMFAFVVYDIPKRRFLFSRDRFGEKPFFFHWHQEVLSFSSELTSLMEHAHVARRMDRRALAYYLHTTLVPAPLTMLEDVQSLPPGHSLVVEKSRIRSFPYFQPKYQVNTSIKSPQDAIDFIHPVLEKAVLRQTVSDVPLGAFLSGGIDSSTIAALLQKQSSEKIKTFTVRFEEASYDESPIAREVAQKLGTDHHEITIPNQDFSAETFWMIVDHVGSPFADSSAIPTFFITKEIRKHVTVALSGDGGDELFAGYPVYQWWQKIASIRRIPRLARTLALGGINQLRHFSFLPGQQQMRQASRALEVAQGDMRATGRLLHAMFSQAEIAKHPKICSDGRPPEYSLMETHDDHTGWTDLQQSMLYRLQHDLPLDMLVKVDRMSMANSLEVRAPFLDPDLFDAAAQLPVEHLIHEGNGKHIIREIMQPYLPDSVFNHPKTGFSIPLHRYFNRDFEALTDQLLLNNERIHNLFSSAFVKTVVTEGLTRSQDSGSQSVYKTSHRLWTLLMLAGWMERFNIE